MTLHGSLIGVYHWYWHFADGTGAASLMLTQCDSAWHHCGCGGIQINYYNFCPPTHQ
jgi:hypothetical protein